MTIFAAKPAAIADFRARFAGSQLLQAACANEALIYAKLLAAESTVEHTLRVFLEPVQVFCGDDDNEAAIDALQAGQRYVEEPGYDYDPGAFGSNTWGYLLTNHHPIIQMQSYRFVYTKQGPQVFAVPASWWRIDKKYGHVRLLPSGEQAALPLNAYLLSVMGAGATVPNFVRLNYTAGLRDIRKDFPGLLDFVYRIAALGMLLDSFPGSNASISMDGLSESAGFDISMYADLTKGVIQQEYKTWGDIIHGVRLIVA